MRRLSAVCLQKVPRVASRRSCGNGRSLSSGGRVSSRNRFALFIIGRIKDRLIVYGRNHSPDDIEATVQEITRSRCVAIAVPDGHTEKLVVIIEVKKRGDSDEEVMHKFGVIKPDVTSAISNSTASVSRISLW